LEVMVYSYLVAMKSKLMNVGTILKFERIPNF
jgi:hypothetical protein